MHARPRIRKKTLYTWLILTIIILVLYLTNRKWFDISFLQSVVDDHKWLVVIVYLMILSVLGLAFIPSTAFAIASVLLFPPLEAYILNLIGIVSSSTIVYYFTKYLRLDGWVEGKYPEKIIKVKTALQKKELPIIAGWSFFPVVPTDLIIYVSSTLRVPYWKCILGVLIGEGTLNAFYIFSIDIFF